MDAAGFNDKPATVQGNLAKLPHALGPLVVRPQWCNWKWIRSAAGVWQKPPFQARDPRRHASSTDPETWADYATALATVQAGLAEGLTYMLTGDEPLAAIDIDHCRNRESEGIDEWAQTLLAQAGAAYVEITPSGSGLRVWGTAKGAPLARNIRPLNVSKDAGIEFYRRPEATKPLTISGLQIGSCRKLSNIDALIDRALAWAEQHKGAALETNTGPSVSLRTYSIDEIERAVREGAPDDANRSNLFHAIVGHYWALGWEMDQIAAHLERYPDGIADRYLFQARLRTAQPRQVAQDEEGAVRNRQLDSYPGAAAVGAGAGAVRGAGRGAAGGRA